VWCAGSKTETVRLELAADEAGDVLMVKHLARQVCIETGVDLWNQLLSFKGPPLVLLSVFAVGSTMFATTGCTNL